MKINLRFILKLIFITPAAMPVVFSANAQQMEPRAYSNAPIGMNFLLMGYGYSKGSLLFDPSLPVQGANAKVNIASFGLAHSFGLSGKSAKFAIVMPYVGLDADGYVEGEYREREVNGLADPMLALTVNLVGAPALTLKDFGKYRQKTIIGTTLKVTTPFGQYESDKAINIGTNRWAINPEIGISKALGRWILECSTGVTFYSNNDNFFNGKMVSQEPIYSTQGHVVFNFKPGLWAAMDATYYTGGTTTVAGIRKDNRLDNWRYGLTIAVPINKHNAIKLAASRGIFTRTGTDFNGYQLAWQYRWGGGL